MVSTYEKKREIHTHTVDLTRWQLINWLFKHFIAGFHLLTHKNQRIYIFYLFIGQNAQRGQSAPPRHIFEKKQQQKNSASKNDPFHCFYRH